MGRNYDGIRGYALNAIQNNPSVRDNPQYADMIRAIQSGDAQAGQAIANKLLQNYGVSKEAAVSRGIQFFNFPMGGR